MGTLKVKDGTWKPVGYTDTDEVWVGPDTPVSPSAELWYDTDEAAAVVEQTNNWNAAWGVIAEARWSSSWTNATSSSTQITATSGSNSFTVYLSASRRYRLYWQGMVTSTAGGGSEYVVLQFNINGSQHSENNAQFISAANAQYFTWLESRYIPPADGNYTFYVTGRRGGSSTGTVSVINTGNNPLWLMIEDLGPVTKAGVSPPEGQPMLTTAGNALGVVAVGSFPYASGGTQAIPANTATKLTSDLTFTPQVGRRYRLVCWVRVTNASGVGHLNLIASGLGASSDSWSPLSGNYSSARHEHVFDGTGVATTYSVAANPQGVTATLYLNTSSAFYIEDVGPNSSPPLPLIAQPAPWLPLTYQNGWRDYGGAYTIGGYRKIGDIVYLRGLLAAGTVSSSVPAFNLPAGYRPRYFMHIPAASADIFGIVRVGTDGNVTLWNNTGANGWFSLDSILFSVT